MPIVPQSMTMIEFCEWIVAVPVTGSRDFSSRTEALAWAGHVRSLISQLGVPAQHTGRRIPAPFNYQASATTFTPDGPRSRLAYDFEPSVAAAAAGLIADLTGAVTDPTPLIGEPLSDLTYTWIRSALMDPQHGLTAYTAARELVGVLAVIAHMIPAHEAAAFNQLVNMTRLARIANDAHNLPKQ